MAKRLVDRLSYSNVVATLALFVALGGASYAAIKVPSTGYNFPIFRLPPGYRPDSTRLFTTNGKVRDLEVSVGRIDVAPNGLVTLVVDCRSGDIECSAHGDFVSLDGISFRPDE